MIRPQKNRILQFLMLFISAYFFASCFRDVHRAVTKRFPLGNAEFEIRSMNSGCCGCKLLYANKYRGERIEEQFLHEYTCGIGQPTKYLFEYVENKTTARVTPLMAVFDSSYTTAATSEERQLFGKLDSLLKAQNVQTSTSYSRITGFRTAHSQDSIHPFAVGHDGKSIYR